MSNGETSSLDDDNVENDNSDDCRICLEVPRCVVLLIQIGSYNSGKLNMREEEGGVFSRQSHERKSREDKGKLT
jgi:hypothetical protein